VTARLYDFDGRVYLESRRFDRVGVRGRIPALSLSMVDAEFAGEPLCWTAAAQALHDRGLLNASSLHEIGWLETFGSWIGDTDMHLGNVALSPTERGFRLLPAYDILPMALAPTRGEVRDAELRPPLRTRANDGVWDSAGEAALRYWVTLAGEKRLSADFQSLCGQWVSALREAVLSS